MTKLKPKWIRDIDWITGKPTGAMPFCPVCEEPLYDTEKCTFCGQEIDQTDEQLIEWLKPQEVKTMDCFRCGGKGTVEYVVSRYNGHKRGSCTACGMSFIE